MKFLFLCTHNRCRSILAEAIARQILGHQCTVASAGTAPARKVHPLTLEQLALYDIPVRGLRAKSVEAVSDFAADVVITVCDSANESCPVSMGPARRVHWDLPDPSLLSDDRNSCDEAFARVIATLTFRINRLKVLLDQDNSIDMLEREMHALAHSFVEVAAIPG